jgi:chemotaxis protein methyltransferase CheR
MTQGARPDQRRTQMNDKFLMFTTPILVKVQKAQDGIYPLRHIKQYTANYQQAGGLGSFADYYHAQYESAILDQSLKVNLTFTNHNLVTDGVFSKVHLVFCRNVLIYFDRTLQNRALKLLTDSLSYGGFLCLGTKETLDFSEVTKQFKVIDAEQRIYQKHAT